MISLMGISPKFSRTFTALSTSHLLILAIKTYKRPSTSVFVSRHTFPCLTALPGLSFHTSHDPSVSARYAVGLLVQIAVEGALNVVRQAYALGTRRVSFISSVIAFVDPATPVYTRLVRSTDWNPLTVEDARMIKNDMITYSVSKKSAEKALWKFAEKHPDLNFVSGQCFVFRLGWDREWCR